MDLGRLDPQAVEPAAEIVPADLELPAGRIEADVECPGDWVDPPDDTGDEFPTAVDASNSWMNPCNYSAGQGTTIGTISDIIVFTRGELDRDHELVPCDEHLPRDLRRGVTREPGA
jgi:hypothetical protein